MFISVNFKMQQNSNAGGILPVFLYAAENLYPAKSIDFPYHRSETFSFPH